MKERKEQALLLFSFLPLIQQKNSFVHYREERKRELGGNRQKSAGFLPILHLVGCAFENRCRGVESVF
ncbi:MAG: hypothetical protein PUC24_05700 [Oscillospiraceae bacterium]|nr:hypothetical protein [Oscillospiraceae bacterium]